MGYSSYIESGQDLLFSRPLTAREVRDALTFIENTGYLQHFLQLNVITEKVETDEGTLIKTTADSLVTTGEEGKAYDLEGGLAQFLSILPLDVTASGAIERIGEEWPDAERLYVRSRRVISVKPEITWTSPEGEIEKVKAYGS
jgi:hypothetical protein